MPAKTPAFNGPPFPVDRLGLNKSKNDVRTRTEIHLLGKALVTGEAFPKLTGFWEMLKVFSILSMELSIIK
jgi:hypothetical protein